MCAGACVPRPLVKTLPRMVIGPPSPCLASPLVVSTSTGPWPLALRSHFRSLTNSSPFGAAPGTSASVEYCLVTGLFSCGLWKVKLALIGNRPGAAVSGTVTCQVVLNDFSPGRIALKLVVVAFAVQPCGTWSVAWTRAIGRRPALLTEVV